MRFPFTPYKRPGRFILVMALVGVGLSVLTFRTALRQDDHFRIFTSIIWLVLLGIVPARNSYRLK